MYPSHQRLFISPHTAPKRLTILGSTGTIGQNTVDLVMQHPRAYEVVALTAHSNAEKLIEQARLLKPKLAVIEKPEAYAMVKEALSGTETEIACGKQALEEAVELETDLVISAITGAAALQPTLSAIRKGRAVGLANKECLVCAGDLFVQEVRKHRAHILPIDSEHNALFQTIGREQADIIESVTLTASGGPFRTLSREEMAHITPEQAVVHPNWKMGAKISVDSATLMNKGLEVIEAYYLFPFLDKTQIKVVVHPESVIHSLVSYLDGSSVAALSHPDMRIPISYALAWPGRMKNNARRLDLTQLGKLSFEMPDIERFPSLVLAQQALKSGGTATTVLNAANEIAVKHFLAENIGFLDIARVVEQVLSAMAPESMLSIAQVMEIDAQARQAAESFIGRL